MQIIHRVNNYGLSVLCGQMYPNIITNKHKNTTCKKCLKRILDDNIFDNHKPINRNARI